MVNYKLKDISVIIPTFNRPDDVIETLKHIPDTIREIIIVNQGPDINLRKINKEIPIKIVRSEPPSITIARNKGLQYATGSLICYIDDDVTPNEGYFEGMIRIFNSYPNIKGAAGYRPIEMSNYQKILEVFKSLFSLRQFGRPIFTSPYGNRYPTKKDFQVLVYSYGEYLRLPGTSENLYAEWLPGMNMMFKKEVFDEDKRRFDENLLGYTIAEDIDFTYSIFKSNPRGLIMTPYATIIHRDAQTHRKDIKKLMYINQVDHLYFAMKHKHNMLGRWWWNIFGISLLRLCAIPFQPRKSLYFFQSLSYCFMNWDLIKQGKVREWQNANSKTQ